MSFKGHINLQLQLKTSFEIISSYKSFQFDSIVAMSVHCLQNKNEKYLLETIDLYQSLD